MGLFDKKPKREPEPRKKNRICYICNKIDIGLEERPSDGWELVANRSKSGNYGIDLVYVCGKCFKKHTVTKD